MGHVRRTVRIANPDDIAETVELPNVLVDTGATWTVLPRRYAEQLQLTVVDRWTVRTATGTQLLDQAFLWMQLEDVVLVDSVLISDTYPEAILGVTALEKMGFAADPVNDRLIPAELLLL